MQRTIATAIVYGGYIRVYRGYIGIMEKKLDTTIWSLGFRVYTKPSTPNAAWSRVWGCLASNESHLLSRFIPEVFNGPQVPKSSKP